MKLRVENTLTRNNLVCSLLKILRFLILELHFEIFFPTILNFLITFMIWVWTSSIFSSKFRHSRQKCILRVQTNLRWRIGFRLENVRVFHKHLDSTQKMSDFWWRNSARSSELPFTWPEDHFEEKTTSREN